jgi:hypothetical protein
VRSKRATTQADGSGAFNDDPAYSLTFRAYHGPFQRYTEDEPRTLDAWESCDLLPVVDLDEEPAAATMLGWAVAR